MCLGSIYEGMTLMIDLVEAYKREVAIPGAFSTAFPSTTDDQIAAALSDGFGKARLDGFFGSIAFDPDVMEATPDLSVAGAALVVMYAAEALIRVQLRTLAAGGSVRYKAGSVEMDKSSAASVLAEDLKQLAQRRREIVENAMAGRGTATFVLEGYVSRGPDHNYYGGLYPYEAAMPRWDVF